MPVLRRRLVAATATAALLCSLPSCGKGGDAAAQPPVTAVPTAVPTVAPTGLTPVAVDDPFVGMRASADRLNLVADRIAEGFNRPDAGGIWNSPGADLRARLAQLLTEHVYLVGIAVQTAYAKSETSQAAKDALAVLDLNSAALGKVVGENFTKPDAAVFLEGWRGHVKSLFAYAVAVGDGKYPDQLKAAGELDSYRVAAADFFARITKGKLPAYLVSAELKTHITSLKDAIDGYAADKGGSDLLRVAADNMGQTAAAFAKGFVVAAALAAGKGTGPPADEVESNISAVRADLRRYMTAHTYLAGGAFMTAFTNARSVRSVPYTAVKATLEDNSKALALAIREVSDSTGQVKFLEEWRGQIADLEDYVGGLADDRERISQGALDYLEGYPAEAGAFLATLGKGNAFVTKRYADDLEAYLESFTGTIGALKALLVRTRSS